MREFFKVFGVCGVLFLVLLFVVKFDADNTKETVQRARAECANFGGIFLVNTSSLTLGNTYDVRVECMEQRATILWSYK